MKPDAGGCSISDASLLSWQGGAPTPGARFSATSGQAVEVLVRCLPDALVASVPDDLDADAFVLLSLASATGVAGAVADVLRRDATAVAPALSVLGIALADRPLVVEDLDLLTSAVGEVADITAPRRREVANWLRTRATVSLERSADVTPVPLAPNLQSGWDAAALWSLVAQDPERFVLATAMRSWLAVTPSSERLDSASLVADLWEALPTEIRNVIAVLVVHGRPVPRALALRARLVDAPALKEAIDGWLVDEVAGSLRVSPAWYAHLPTIAPARGELHRRIADAFADVATKADSPESWLAVLEAHRHYIEQPDLLRAREFARFGAGYLLDHARKQSEARSYPAAAAEYDAVLRLDDDARAQGANAVGQHARAYALHYRHFNRARAQSEGTAETLAGYEGALTLWPENALFWSRVVRCKFLAGAWHDALRALRDAYDRVPEHPKRDSVLVVRTAERLFLRQQVIPALLVATDRPLHARALSKLWQGLADGQPVDRVWVPQGEEIRLVSKVSLKVSQLEPIARWEAHWMGSSARGATVRAALQNLCAQIVSTAIAALEEAHVSADVAGVNVLDTPWAASATQGVRWWALLVDLDRRVRTGTMASAQRDAVLAIWRGARGRVPDVRRPAMGRTSEGGYYLSWAYADRDAVVTIEVSEDGACDWFARDASGSRGGEGSVMEALDALATTLETCGS